jgi:hypothetical protein
MNLLILIACGVISLGALAVSAAAVRKENRSSANQFRKREWRGSAATEQVEPEKKVATASHV